MYANFEIIQRQMGHLVGDKVRRAYDHSKMLKKKEFLENWGKLLVNQGYYFNKIAIKLLRRHSSFALQRD